MVAARVRVSFFCAYAERAQGSVGQRNSDLVADLKQLIQQKT